MLIDTPIGVDVAPPASASETVGFRRATAIVKLEVAAVAELLSVTVITIAKLPAVDGVPEITPEEELSETPEGRAPVVNVKTFPPEPPDVERLSVYDELKVAASAPPEGVVIDSVDEIVKERVTALAES